MKVIDIFAGCGGLSSGFHSQGIEVVAHLDWDKSCINTLKENYSIKSQLNYETRFFHEDIRNTNNLFTSSIDSLSNWIESNNTIHGIIGGPPCQAYSIAGRVRDPNGMQLDYRNYLFESYAQILNLINPDFFVFENVPGILSSAPNNVKIIDRVYETFKQVNFLINPINKSHIYDLSSFGGPQKRRRVIIFGINQKKFTLESQGILNDFYNNLNQEITSATTVADAIQDLPKIFPLKHPQRRISHYYDGDDTLHSPRFHNSRDIEIFKILAKDALKKVPKYQSIKSKQLLYTEKVGKTSAVHKYNVLNWNKQSNLIPAHLYKDGLRHIHPDPEQARSITAREAARLQTFPDTYKFIGSKTESFKMIGNAVPPLMASKIAKAILRLKL